MGTLRLIYFFNLRLGSNGKDVVLFNISLFRQLIY
jgi:hypothetical protein